MPAILGLRGTGDWATDERPKNWREMILYLFPNGEAPLMGALSKLGSEPTDDPEFHWWEKELPAATVTVASYSGTATSGTITLDGDANLCPKGTVLENFNSSPAGEVMYVDQDPTTDTEVHVVRNLNGLTTPSDPASTNVLHIVTANYRHGSPLPTAVGTNPVKNNNYTEIHRTPLSMTRTAMKTRLRTGEAWRNAKIEALQIHSIRCEQPLFVGRAVSTTFEGQPMYFTGGHKHFTPSGNVLSIGNFTEDFWDEKMRVMYEFGNLEKMMYSGSKVSLSLTTMAKKQGFTMIDVGNQAWGQKITALQGPAMGILYIKIHPLLTRITKYQDDGFVFDLPKMTWRYIDDTQYVTFRQNRGDDFRSDEFLTEGGLEFHHAKSFFKLEDFGSFLS